VSDRINEAITALRSASEITSAHDALKKLGGLIEDLTLEGGQVDELAGELHDVEAKVTELQAALNGAKADLDSFKDEHGFFRRAFGSNRRDWVKLRKLVKSRAKDLARGRALEIGLTLMLDDSGGAGARPTGLRAAEWRERVEAATAEGPEGLAKVLLALRDESKSDSELVGRLQGALSTHGRAMRRSKLRKLVRAMNKGLGRAADDVDLQEALYNDALITLRTLVEAEIRMHEQRFVEETTAAEWLADVTPLLDEMVVAVEAGQKASDALELALPVEAQANQQLEDNEAKLAELNDRLSALSQGGGGGGGGGSSVPPGMLLDRTRLRTDLFAGRFGASLGSLDLSSSAFSAASVSRVSVARAASHSVGTGSGSSSSTPAAATPSAGASALASSAVLRNFQPSLEMMSGIRPLRPITVPPVVGVPPRPRPPIRPTPPADPNAAAKKTLEAEITTVKEQLVARRGAASRASADVQRTRHALGRALATLDHNIAAFHTYLATWPELSTMPVAVIQGLPVLDLGSGVGLAGPEGGLLPGTIGLAKVGTGEHMAALEEFFVSLLAEARAMAGIVSEEFEALTDSTDGVIQERMETLLGGSTEPI